MVTQSQIQDASDPTDLIPQRRSKVLRCVAVVGAVEASIHVRIDLLGLNDGAMAISVPAQVSTMRRVGQAALRRCQIMDLVIPGAGLSVHVYAIVRHPAAFLGINPRLGDRCGELLARKCMSTPLGPMEAQGIRYVDSTMVSEL